MRGPESELRASRSRVAGLTAEVVGLVRRGKKIQAIKLYRELTNADLKTAKDVIDHL